MMQGEGEAYTPDGKAVSEMVIRLVILPYARRKEAEGVSFAAAQAALINGIVDSMVVLLHGLNAEGREKVIALIPEQLRASLTDFDSFVRPGPGTVFQ